MFKIYKLFLYVSYFNFFGNILARTREILFDMPKVDETPELLGDSNADLLPPPSVPTVAASIALKLPVFWPKAAEVWFAQADAQFAIKSIAVSKTKFYHAVASLPQDVAAQILDLILALLPETLTRFLKSVLQSSIL